MKHPFSSILRAMIIPAVLGLLAGAAGGLYGFSYYLSTQVEPPAAPNRPNFSVTTPLPEVEIASRLAQLNLPLFLKKSAPNAADADGAILAEQAVGTAAALTSDGWLLTDQAVLKNGPVTVAVGGRLLDPKTVVQDPATGAAFLKIDAAALQVSGFEETDKLARGSALFAEDGGGQFVPSAFTGTSLSDRKGRPKALLSSDQFSKTYRLDRAFPAAAVGGAVVTSSGNLAGIVAPGPDGETASFIPIHLLRPILADVFRGQPSPRVVLGLNYLSPDAVTGTASPQGLVVTGSKKWGVPAVSAGGPAAAAGLMEGDLLVRIGDTDLTGDRELSEILEEYPHGAKVTVEAVRTGERKSFDVTLR